MDTSAVILVVDDDPNLLSAMARVLKAAGNTVLEAATGMEGVLLAREHRPDLMIVDLMLPDIDGLEVCRRVRAAAELAEVETILISSIRTSSEEQADGLTAGVCEYIARPMPNREFLARVEARLREKKARDSLKAARDTATTITGEQALELGRSAATLQEAIFLKEQEKQGRIDLEEELQTIFTHAPICLLLTDGDARLHKANPAVAELFGSDTDTVLGHPCGIAFGCVHATDHPAGCGFGPHCAGCGVRRAITDTFTSGRTHLQKETIISSRQEDIIIERSVRFCTSPVMIAGEKRVFVCLEDITERKRTEHALDLQRNRFKQVLEAFPHGIYIADCNHNIEYVNPTLEREFGPVAGRKCHAYFQDLSEPCPWCKNHQVFQGRMVRWEHHMAKNNRDYDLIDIPLLNADGTFSKLEVIQDVTEQKRAAAALLASDEKSRFLADMLQSSSQPFAAGTADGRLVLVNSAYCSLVGYSEEELRAIKWNKELTPPEYLELESRVITQLLASGQPLKYEKEYIHKDGRRIPLELLAHIRQNEGGKPDVFYAFFTDLTERKQQEQETKKLNEQLFQAQKMESVGRLAGGVAHDYNNMLSVIMGYAQMALEKTDPASPVYEDLLEIHEAGQRSVNITRQLLAFARKQTVAPQILDLNKNVEGMLKMLKRLIGEDINLIWLPSPALPTVKIDPSQIDQLLANLCVNARDAITGVGKITIETGRATLDVGYCAVHQGAVPGEYVLLAVSDNGHGMEKEVLDKIFEPFFTTKEMGRGTGLGLATVYGIVKQNNGFVYVYSEPGEGTTFKIYLPEHAEDITGGAKEPEGNPQRGAGETVLVVEDEAVMLKLTARMLADQGYSVLTAGTSKEAIRLAHDNAGKIDLLLVDVIMPEMNGRELAELLITFQPGLKCLFMSGYTSTVIAAHGILEEGVHFIQKPFSAKDLAAKVRKVLVS